MTDLQWVQQAIYNALVNLAVSPRDLTNAAWVKTNMTAVKDQTGADGTPAAATKLTATAGNATVSQVEVFPASSRLQSAYVKRITGTGVVEMTTDANVADWVPIPVTASWALVFIPAKTVTNPNFGFRIATNGDSIAVDFVTNEPLTYPVYDPVPQGVAKPYITIGEWTGLPDEELQAASTDATVSLHTWSATNGKAQSYAMLQFIRARLDGQTIDGAWFCVEDFVELMEDPGSMAAARLYHGVARYRVRL